MRQKTPTTEPRRFWLLALASSAVAAMVSACKTHIPPAAPPAVAAPAPEPSSPVIGPIPASQGSARSSAATTPRAYRADGATHLYGLNADRIFKGRMPPLLYAIGVLNVEIDRVGRVTRLDWMRAPNHAPEVVAEIERTVRSAAPFPAPGSPALLGNFIEADYRAWRNVVKSQNLKLD